MKEIPIYLFLGFLESGKTKFIQETLCDERFNTGEKTLLIVCEEGIEEYEPAEFSGKNVTVEFIEDESLLNAKVLSELQKKTAAERIIVEYNGMWQVGTLLNNLPKGWIVCQCMMFADASTFENYNANMRSLVVDKLQVCELVVFNRMSDGIDKMALHKIVRGVSRRADIAYEYPDLHVEYDEIEDPLPFDIEASVIYIEDRDYAIWYRDMLDEPDKYEGKTVKFKGVAAYDKRLPKNIFVAGRHIMTCCIDDVEYSPLLCICNDNHAVQTRDWLMVTGVVRHEYSKFYKGKGPVIHVTDIAVTSMPEQELATFY